MEQFCKEVIRFLQSEYNNNYVFEIEHFNSTSPRGLFNDNTIELKIKNNGYVRKIADCYMQKLFLLYNSQEFIKERQQYRWQKELIDFIEGS